MRRRKCLSCKNLTPQISISELWLDLYLSQLKTFQSCQSRKMRAVPFLLITTFNILPSKYKLTVRKAYLSSKVIMQIPTPTYPIPPFAPDYSGVRAQKIPNPKYPIPPFAPHYYFEAGDHRTPSPNYPNPRVAPDYSGGGCPQKDDCCVCGSCTRTQCHVLCIASGRRPAACSSMCCCCSPGGSAAAW